MKYNSEIRDIGLAPSGHQKMNWAERNMPVLAQIAEEFEKTRPLEGLRVAVSVHVEAKTAVFATVLERGGAKVAITGCNPLSTQDDVAAALVERGLTVFTLHDASAEEYVSHLKKTLEFSPHIVIDDGGDLADLLHHECKDKGANLLGICEETTTGVHRLRNWAKTGQLLYPAVAVNEARCKYLFDNRFGTGQSVWTAIMSLTNLVVAGKIVVVAGFGMCGKGVALRAKGLGAQVIVTEVDPVAACEALMEGYQVMTMEQAAPLGDVFVTVTGTRDIITGAHFAKMKDGALLSNAGHFDVEINLDDLRRDAVETKKARPNVMGFTMENGNTLNLLAAGRLVNLAGGDGHPVEIMDMSFALQAQSARYLAEEGATLKPDLYDVPDHLDRKVAELMLKARGLRIDTLTAAQKEYLGEETERGARETS